MRELLRRLFSKPRPAMASAQRLIIGLGNPGADYVSTRHNAGFMVVDAVADRIKAPAFEHGRGNTLLTSGRMRGRPVVLAKPLTYMNRSGAAARALLNLYGLEPDNMLVVYDDIALPAGKLRLRPQGSAGGHNGIQDIIDAIGTDVFPRLRFGVGSHFARGRQVDYVLSPFSDEQTEDVEVGISRAVDAVVTFVAEGITTSMNRFN